MLGELFKILKHYEAYNTAADAKQAKQYLRGVGVAGADKVLLLAQNDIENLTKIMKPYPRRLYCTNCRSWKIVRSGSLNCSKKKGLTVGGGSGRGRNEGAIKSNAVVGGEKS
ncbi:hypothetical protein EON65_37305 [archaeon]|nr:MAG: hypothetical protein EON65_37305 [archaeon]